MMVRNVSHVDVRNVLIIAMKGNVKYVVLVKLNIVPLIIRAKTEYVNRYQNKKNRPRHVLTLVIIKNYVSVMMVNVRNVFSLLDAKNVNVARIDVLGMVYVLIVLVIVNAKKINVNVTMVSFFIR